MHRRLGLRQFAKMVGVSPTYQSKIERDELPAPAEDKVVRMAELLELDRDELLALANRVASDVTAIIKRVSMMLAWVAVSDSATPRWILSPCQRAPRRASHEGNRPLAAPGAVGTTAIRRGAGCDLVGRRAQASAQSRLRAIEPGRLAPPILQRALSS